MRDLSGHRFTRLVAMIPDPIRVNKSVMWQCVCDCGALKLVRADHLTRGLTKSCGCLMPESSAQLCRSRAKHNLSGTRLYHSWNAMVGRCLHANNPSFKKYGARGIWVCAFLSESPSGIKSVIGERPEGKTLDRKDTKGGYTCGQCPQCSKNGWPLNIRWLTPTEQARNMNSNVLIEVDGKVRCAAEWSEITGININTLLHRAHHGWASDRILTIPKYKRRTK